jgi:hypothetical protein
MAARKKNLNAVTVRKMRAVIAAVQAEPQFLDQDELPGPQDTCITPCCGIGWVLWLENPDQYLNMLKSYSTDSWWRYFSWLKGMAERILGLEDTRERLFGSASEWPIPFSNQYANAKTARGRAEVFALRWEHFIQTDGAE